MLEEPHPLAEGLQCAGVGTVLQGRDGLRFLLLDSSFQCFPAF